MALQTRGGKKGARGRGEFRRFLAGAEPSIQAKAKWPGRGGKTEEAGPRNPQPPGNERRVLSKKGFTRHNLEVTKSCELIVRG